MINPTGTNKSRYDALCTPDKLEDLFQSMVTYERPVEDEGYCYRNLRVLHSFWLRDNDKGYKHVTITEDLADLISKFIIYEVNPNNIYFHLVNDSLYIQYQQIIGSRKLLDNYSKITNDLTCC